MSRLVILPSLTTLPTCNPNLMPFHIDYDGLAPVSAFMRVKPMQPEPFGVDSSPEVVEEEGTARNASGDAMNVDSTSQPESAALTSQHLDIDIANAAGDCQPTPSITRSNTESTLVVESHTSGSISSQSTLLQLPAGSPPPPVLEDIDKRVVSSFRGRTMHGLSVDLPPGYSGLVLQSDGEVNSGAQAKGGAEEDSVEESKNAKVAGKAKAKAAQKTGSKPRGRLTRSAAPKRPEVIEIEDEGEEMTEAPSSVQLQENQRPSDNAEALPDAPPSRSLVPKAQFSSFTLWHADRPVERTHDEYYRTLEEWIALSHEIHRTDITFGD